MVVQIISVNSALWICRINNLCNWTYFLKSIAIDIAIVVLTSIRIFLI